MSSSCSTILPKKFAVYIILAVVLLGSVIVGFGNPVYAQLVPSKLAFTVQPSITVAGVAISTVQVAVQDASGITVPTATNSITISIGTNAGGGTLSGTTTVSAVAGIATFSNLSIDKAGTGYTLVASSGSLTSATSASFNINAASATLLAFTVQPSTTTAGAAIPDVKVAIKDAFGNTVTTATNTITIAIGTNPSTGTLSGTASVNAIAGIATFSGLSIDKAGTGYTLVASSGLLTSATSASFTINAAAAASIAVTPAVAINIVVGGTQAFTGKVLDAFGNERTSDSASIAWTATGGSVSASLASSTTFTAGTTAGPASVTASFTGLASVTKNFSLLPGTATKLAFTVGAAQTLTAGAASAQITVQIRDLFNNPVTAGTNVIVTLSSTSSGGQFSTSSSFTSTITTITIPSGSNSATFFYKDTVAGSPTLTASSAGLTSATTTFTINPAAASKLVFTSGIGQTLTVGTVSSQITVQIQDGFGNAVNAGIGGLIINLASSSPSGRFDTSAGGAFDGTITSVPIPSGSNSATFFYKDTVAGSPTLTASSAGLTSATTTIQVGIPVPMTSSGGVLSGTANLGTVTANLPVALTLTNNVLPSAQLNGVGFTPVFDGTNVGLGITVSNQVLGVTPPANVNVALFFEFAPSGSLDLSQPSSFAGSTGLPKVTFQVDKINGACPTTALFFFDVGLNQWVQLTSPTLLSQTSQSCIEQGQLPHFSKFAVGVTPTGGGGIGTIGGGGGVGTTGRGSGGPDFVVVDETAPSILNDYWKPDLPSAGRNLTIYANIVDDVGVKSAAVLYYGPNENYKQAHLVSMKNVNNEWFATDIPGSDVNTPDINFWIVAEDDAGNSVKSTVTAVKVGQAQPVPEEKTKTIPVSVLQAIKPVSVTPSQKLEVTSMKGGKEIKSLPAKILIRNTGNITADNIRIMLSPEIAKNFRLSHLMINSIKPHSNVTIALELIGARNKDVFGGLMDYNGNVIVMGEHLTPITLPVNIAGEQSNSLSSFMDKVASLAEQRSKMIFLLNSILSKHPNIQSNYEVATSKGENVITNPSGEIVIKNLSDKELKNLRMIIYGAGNVFLLENKVIHHLDPHAQISIKMIPTIDTRNYSPKDFKGELLIVPSNDNPIHIPINITAADRKDSANEFEVSTLLGKDGIFTGADKVVIKNLGNRTMDSVKLVLSSNLARVLTLSTDSFKNIEPNGQVVVDAKFKEEKGERNGLQYNYQGELVVVSEHHKQKVIPINIVWKELSSDHFTVYVRNNQTDMAKAKDVISILESNYQKVASRFGEMNSKTVIYMTHSMDELKTITKNNSYYASQDDKIFICACDDDVKSLAMKKFVHRIIFNEFPNYSDKQKFLLDGENWLMDGIANYIAANMTGEHGMVKKELEAFKAKPTSFVWYGSGSLEQYGAAYTFFGYLQEKYGDKVIDRTLYYLGSGMVSNHRCDTLEDCAVLRAVYDVSGWSMNKSYAHTVDVKTVVSEWEDYVEHSYHVVWKR